MKGTGRLIVLLLLLALVLQDYLSSKILNLSLDTLGESQAAYGLAIGEQVVREIQETKDSVSDDFLNAVVKRHRLEGAVLRNDQGQLVAISPKPFPGDAASLVKAPKKSEEAKTYVRSGDYFLQRSTVQIGARNYILLLVFSSRTTSQIERSTSILGYLNFLILALTALLGFYFIQSTLRPFRVLMQTAKSAQPEMPVTEARNDADFLIGTFKGVIAKLKEKELELGRLHQSEKARADDVQHLNQDLLRSINSGLILADRAGKIQVFNQAAQAILRISPVTALSQQYSKVLAGLSDGFLDDLQRCLEDQSTITRAELEIKTGQGETRFLTTNVMPARDRQQAFAGVLCIFTDITENKLLQQHIAQKEKFASLGEMAAGVAHEFRNSLATIGGYLQMAENRTDAAPQVYISPIRKELDLLQKVVNDFLSFAKPLPLRLGRVDLGELLRECVEEAKISNHERQIDYSFGGTFPEISGDETMLRQVFLNLLRNAADAISDAGRNGKTEIAGFLSPQGKYSVIEIRDNGCGIPAENLSRIFTPFFSTKEQGVGLGLAIVQKIVLQHNGTVTAESNADGAVFRIQIPVEQMPPAT